MRMTPIQKIVTCAVTTTVALATIVTFAQGDDNPIHDAITAIPLPHGGEMPTVTEAPPSSATPPGPETPLLGSPTPTAGARKVSSTQTGATPSTPSSAPTSSPTTKPPTTAPPTTPAPTPTTKPRQCVLLIICN